MNNHQLPWIGRTASPRKPPAMLLIPALMVMAALLIPLLYLILRSVQGGTRSSDLLFRTRTLDVLVKTIVLAVAVSATASVIGISAAWLTERVRLPANRIWPIMMTLPLVIPSYVAAMCYVAMFGSRGLVFDFLNAQFGVSRIPAIYGFTGAWLTLSLFTFPYVYLTVRAALSRLDPRMAEASKGLGSGTARTFFKVTVPMLRPAIVAGALLSALYTVSDFGVVTLMRYDALTRAIYMQYRSSFDRTQAATLSLLLVALATGILLLESRSAGRYFASGSGPPGKRPPIEPGKWVFAIVAYLGLIFAITILIPAGLLVYWLIQSDNTRGASGFGSAAFHSISLGAVGSMLAIVLAFSLVYLAVRYDSRIGRLSEKLAWLGYGLPGIVIGLSFVFIGANYLPSLYQTLPLLVIAYLVRFLPQATGSVKTSLLQINPRIEEVARSLGRNQFNTLCTVTLPLASSGLVAGAVMVCLSIMKELPITLLMGPTGYRTLATQIWTGATVNAFGQAAAPALLLIVLAIGPTVLLTLRRSDSIAVDA